MNTAVMVLDAQAPGVTSMDVFLDYNILDHIRKAVDGECSGDQQHLLDLKSRFEREWDAR